MANEEKNPLCKRETALNPPAAGFVEMGKLEERRKTQNSQSQSAGAHQLMKAINGTTLRPSASTSFCAQGLLGWIIPKVPFLTPKPHQGNPCQLLG